MPLADPILGYQLLNIAINRCRPQARAILNMRGHAIGKTSRRQGPTMAATVNCRLMLSDLQTRHRHVKNLTALHPLRHLRRQDAPTGTAMRRLMPFHEVRCWRLTQSVASVANLATTFLTGLTTQATRCRLFKPITRRRFTAISAVLGQLTPQIRILLCHARQRGFQLGDSAQSRGEEMFKGSNLVHSTTDSEKSARRYGIQTRTKASNAIW